MAGIAQIQDDQTRVLDPAVRILESRIKPRLKLIAQLGLVEDLRAWPWAQLSAAEMIVDNRA